MNSKLLWLAMMVIALGCNSLNESKTKEPVSISSHASFTSIGIYFTDKDSIKAQSVIELVQSTLPGYKKINTPPDTLLEDSYLVERHNEFTSELTPPGVEYLAFAGEGLTEQEKQKLQEANSVLVITFLSTKEDIIEKQRSITSFMGELVKGNSNFIADFNTRRFYSPTSWKVERVAAFKGNSIFSEIVIHSFREGEFCRVVSMGMGKFCLPDVSVKSVGCEDQVAFTSLANAITSTWIESPFMNGDSTLVIDLQNFVDTRVKEQVTADVKEGAEQVATIKLQEVNPEIGDNVNRQFRIIFEDKAFKSPQEEQKALIKKLFGK